MYETSKVTRDMTCRILACVSLFLFCGCEPSFDDYNASEAQTRNTSSWSGYGGAGGAKYASLAQIDKANVTDLHPAWVYRSGDVSTVFQATPVLVAGQLVFCSPFNKVISLDPLTGGELWVFDPQIDRGMSPANEFNCRSVTPWQGSNAGECSNRIFTARWFDGSVQSLSGSVALYSLGPRIGASL